MSKKSDFIPLAEPVAAPAEDVGPVVPAVSEAVFWHRHGRHICRFPDALQKQGAREQANFQPFFPGDPTSIEVPQTMMAAYNAIPRHPDFDSKRASFGFRSSFKTANPVEIEFLKGVCQRYNDMIQVVG